MRIDRLDLIAFGPFTDQVLDLAEGREGFHMVFGANEAGKSAALRAIRHALYGIPARSTDDFIHPKNELRIGLTLRDGQRIHHLVRRKGNKNTLRDADSGEVVDETLIADLLGGLDEGAFTDYFGLSHQQLVDGGRSIVSGGGALGAALFAAATGILSLQELKAEIAARLDELFKPGGSKPSINVNLSELDACRRAAKEVLLSPDKWYELDKVLAEAVARRDAAAKRQRALETGRERLERIHRALPLFARRSETIEKRKAVADATVLPEGFSEKRINLGHDKLQAERAIAQTEQTLAALDSQIANLEVDEDLLAQEAIVEQLRERFGANSKALADRREKLEPERLLRLQQADRTLQSLRPGLSIEDAGTLKLAPRDRQRIQRLGQRAEALHARSKDAQAQLEKLRVSRRQTAEALERTGPPADPEGLDAAVRRAQDWGKIEQQLQAQQNASSVLSEEIAASAASLGRWSGPVGQLEALSVPSVETVERFKSDFDGLRRSCDELDKGIQDVQESQRDHERAVTELRARHDVPSEETLARQRAARNRGWSLVRRAWEDACSPLDLASAEAERFVADVQEDSQRPANLADAFEVAVRRADDTSDRLRREADRVARLAQLEAEEAQLEEQLAGLRQEREAAQAALGSRQAEWDALWHAIDIDAASPAEMSVWLRRHSEVVAKLRERREVDVQIESLTQTIGSLRKDVGAALRRLGEPPPQEGESLAALLDRAGTVAGKLRQAAQKRNTLAAQLSVSDKEDIPAAERALRSSDEELAQWKADWGEAVKPLGLRDDAAPQDADVILEQLTQLFDALDKAEDLGQRIGQIVDDDRDFQEQVGELIRAVAEDLADVPADQAVQTMYQQLKRAREDRARLDGLEKQREAEQNSLSEAEETLARTNDALQELCSEAQVDGVEDLPAAEDRSRCRRDLDRELKDIEERILDHSAGLPIGAFLEMAAREDAGTLAGRIDELTEEIESLTQQNRTLGDDIAGLGAELKQMDGSAAAAAAMDQAESLRAAVLREAEEYAQLKAAEYLLNRTIEQFSERNQGPLLQGASPLFAQLTLGSFAGLKAEYDEKGEPVLVGVREDGRYVSVEGMSDGTADQLYLALRLASLDHFLARDNARVVPLILDDILINFDDQRAAATVRILAELSRRTQVIFFTHHQHLVELAQETVPRDTLFQHRL